MDIRKPTLTSRYSENYINVSIFRNPPRRTAPFQEFKNSRQLDTSPVECIHTCISSGKDRQRTNPNTQKLLTEQSIQYNCHEYY
jgi:hypothetical protein